MSRHTFEQLCSNEWYINRFFATRGSENPEIVKEQTQRREYSENGRSKKVARPVPDSFAKLAPNNNLTSNANKSTLLKAINASNIRKL